MVDSVAAPRNLMHCLFVCQAMVVVWLGCWTRASVGDDEAANGDAFITLLDRDEAWERLPDCEQGRGQPLPGWARALVSTLPYTTAAVLELDSIYRESDEIDPLLRNRMRYVSARAIHSEYGLACADYDFRRTAGEDAGLEPLRGDWSGLPMEERLALAFAEKMTIAAHSVTDEEVAALIEHFGERQVVAMVLQVAYANFLDRLVLALGVPVEEGGPLPPFSYRFPALSDIQSIPTAGRPEVALREAATDPQPLPELDSVFGRDWTAELYDDLQQRMELQRERPGRVSIPDWETVRERLPPGMYPRDREMKIRWSLVVLGHQPRLGSAWLRCLRVFGREAAFDRTLGESMFWVVTRSLQCFY